MATFSADHRSADYRWQDHVPRFGAIDLAVTACTALLLVGAAAAGWPTTGHRPLRIEDRQVAARPVADCGAAFAEPAGRKHEPAKEAV